MTGERTTLRDDRPCDLRHVELADGGKCAATTMGTAVIQGQAGTTRVELTLRDVLVVPELAVSLSSVRDVTKQHYRVTLHEETVGVYEGTALLQCGNRRSTLYVLNEECGAEGVAAVAASAHTWHRRFAHASGGTLAAVPTAVTGIEITAEELRKLPTEECEPCICGKMTRTPFPTSDTHSDQPLALFHTYVNGPMPFPTPDGHRHEVVLADDKSKYKEVVAVKAKGEASDVVMDVLIRWEAQLGTKATVIRRDRGKEFTGKRLDKWRSDQGIVVQMTIYAGEKRRSRALQPCAQ